MSAVLQDLLAAHARFVKRVHTTKFILTGYKLRAVQCLYVGGTFAGCMGVLKYMTPPEEEIVAQLSKPIHVRQMAAGAPMPEQMQELQRVLDEARRRKEAQTAQS